MTIEVTGNESIEELEAMMADFEDAELTDDDKSTSDVEVSEPKSQPDHSQQDAPDNADNADSVPAPEAEAGEVEESKDNTPKGVATKDGEHVIPYDVLEREREEKRQLKEQLDALTQKQNEWEQTQRLLQVRDRQLEKLGVAPEDLPENFKMSEEQLDALAEDYPEIGHAIRGLVAKVDAIHTSKQAEPAAESDTETVNADTPHPQDTVSDAVARHPDLAKWSADGGEQWQQAVLFDDQLRANPDWADKSIDERFAEAARLTKLHFTDKARAEAEKVQAKASESLPPSPSETGSTSTHQGSLIDKVANADEGELYGLMSDMSDDEIEDLLAQF